MRISGFTSTGSKRPDALYGANAPPGLPVRMGRAQGCDVWDADGRRYTDFVMGLGAVALGYGHPAVAAAAHAAIEDGVVGPFAPEAEERVAERLATMVPVMERCRFLKTGAEAVAAAVRLARAHTGRAMVLRCGYHGWHDWCQAPETVGVPAAVTALTEELPFNDVDRGRSLIRLMGDRLAGVVVEPVVEREPSADWLAMLREDTSRVGAVLVFDEVKTGFRIHQGGAGGRYHVTPDLVAVGKALANGFPLAAVGGRREMIEQARRTWISSTLATESVSLAAAEATLGVIAAADVPAHLERVGALFFEGLSRLAARYPALITSVAGMPQMCFLRFTSEAGGAELARVATEHGLLFKRSAYNFVSLAHTPEVIAKSLDLLDGACRETARRLG